MSESEWYNENPGLASIGSVLDDMVTKIDDANTMEDIKLRMINAENEIVEDMLVSDTDSMEQWDAMERQHMAAYIQEQEDYSGWMPMDLEELKEETALTDDQWDTIERNRQKALACRLSSLSNENWDPEAEARYLYMEKPTNWDQMPHHILLKIFSLQPYKERIAMAKVCKTWLMVFEDRCLWEECNIFVGNDIPQATHCMWDILEHYRSTPLTRHMTTLNIVSRYDLENVSEHMLAIKIQTYILLFYTMMVGFVKQNFQVTHFSVTGINFRKLDKSDVVITSEHFKRMRVEFIALLSKFITNQKNLKHLIMEKNMFSWHQGITIFKAISSQAASLTHLETPNMFHEDDMWELHQDVSHFYKAIHLTFIRQLVKLKHIHCTYAELSDEVLDAFGNNLKDTLHVFDVDVISWHANGAYPLPVSHSSWQRLGENCPKLKLKMRFKKVPNLEILQEFLAPEIPVHKLNMKIHGSSECTIEGVLSTVGKLVGNNLASLHINAWHVLHDIDPQQLMNSLTNYQKLRHLRIDNHLLMDEIVANVRSKHPRYNLNSTSPPSRKPKDLLECQLVQYGSKFVWWYMHQHGYSDQLIEKLKSLEGNLSTTRKLLRLGKSFDNVHAACKTIHLNDAILRATITMSRLTQALYLLLDNLLWFSKVGLIKIDTPRWTQSSARFWLTSIILNITRVLYDFTRAWTHEYTVIKNAMDYNNDVNASSTGTSPSTHTWSGKVILKYYAVLYTKVITQCLLNCRPLVLELIRNVCDFWIPLTTLGKLNLSPGAVGLLGAVSSAIGILTVWKPVFKLVPA